MREWQKIASAGFVSGFVFVGIAAMMGVAYLWLAFVIGFAAGYLGCEFHDTTRGVSRAWRGTRDFSAPWAAWVRASPLFILIALTACSYVGYSAFAPMVLHPAGNPPRTVAGIFYLALLMMTFVFVHGALVGIAGIGAKMEGKFFFVNPKPFFYVDRYTHAERRRSFHAKGLVEESAGFRNASRWLFSGCFEVFFFLATSWFYLIPAGEIIFCFATRLLLLIHSSKRMMCGSGGVIGGYVAYALFWHAYMTVLQVAISLMSGAILGACGALLEWRVAQAFVDHKASACV